MADKNMEAQISVEFEEATSRQSLNSGETINTLWGKVKRWLSDLKAVAFSGSYIDLSDKPTTATTDTDGLMSAKDKSKLDNADNTYALKSKYGDTTINVGRKADTTVGEYSTAEGSGTTASGNFSHTEGSGTTASGNGSHSEGGNSIASGSFSHAEGADTTASNYSSHAGGSVSEASGRYSFSHGNRTQALHESEVAFGQNNISNDDTLFSIGDGAYNARHNAFEITKTGGKLHDKDIAVKDDIPMELPANGGNADYATNAGNADTVNGRHAYRISTLDANGNPWDANVQNINDAYLQWDGSKYFKLRTFGENLTAVDYATNADTLDGLHADDFVNATNRGQIQIPNNADVPAWIVANGKRFQRYATNGGNTGLTNVPDNSTDYVWYWYDGLNILALEYSSGKYYICNTINDVFSGWKDVYTSGYKPYISGSATVAANSTTCTSNHGFTPSAIIWWDGNYSGVATSFNGTQFTFDKTRPVDRIISYLIFK